MRPGICTVPGRALSWGGGRLPRIVGNRAAPRPQRPCRGRVLVMHKVLRIGCLTAAMAFAASNLVVATAQVLAPDEVHPEDMIPGVLWVQFAEGVAPPDAAGKTGLSVFDRAAEMLGVRDIRPAFPFIEIAAAKRALPPSANELRRVYTVRFDEALDPMRVAAALQKDPGVVYSEPQYSVPVPAVRQGDMAPDAGPVETPNDPFVDRMPYLDRLRLPEAWNVAKGEDGDVVIAIVDAQVDWRHPDLAANIWTNPGEVPDNGVDDDGNGFVDDVRGWSFWNDSPNPGSNVEEGSHGTFMASVAGAVTDNRVGMAGSSWNAAIMPVNASCDATSQRVCFGLNGMAYATLSGADVINASFGSLTATQTARMIWDLVADLDVLIVAAAGNFGTNNDWIPFFPAGHRRTLSVGGTRTGSDEILANYGRSVNVFAPGQDILGILNRDLLALLEGTSASTALVSGIAALVRTRFPQYTADQVREQVRITAQSVDAANDASLAGLLGRGRVDAYLALTETASPAVRLVSEEVVSRMPTSEGLEATVELTFTNYLAAADGLELSLVSDSPWITITQGTESVGSLGTGESHTARFTLVQSEDTPYRSRHLLHTRAAAASYDDAPDILRLLGNTGSVVTHSTEAIAVSITTEGNIGFLDHALNSIGDGFVVRLADGTPENLLFEAGLMVGAGPRASGMLQGRYSGGRTVTSSQRREPRSPFRHPARWLPRRGGWYSWMRGPRASSAWRCCRRPLSMQQPPTRTSLPSSTPCAILQHKPWTQSMWVCLRTGMSISSLPEWMQRVLMSTAAWAFRRTRSRMRSCW